MKLPHLVGLSAGLVMLTNAPLKAADLEALLEWGQRVELGTPVSGVVGEVAVHRGESVEKGDLLLALDARLFQAHVEQAEAAAQEAEQLKAEADRELKRAKELHDRTLLSDRERTLAEIEAARAAAVLRKSQAELAQAKLELEYSQVRAPFAGVVVDVRAHAGETVVSDLQSTPLVVLADRSEMVARALVNADQARQFKPGAPITVSLRDQQIQGTVRGVALEPERPDGLGILYHLDVAFVPPADWVLRVSEPATLMTNGGPRAKEPPAAPEGGEPQPEAKGEKE